MHALVKIQLRTISEDDGKMLINIRNGEPSADVVVLVPTLSGTIFGYLEIVAKLPKHVRVLGLEYAGIDETIQYQAALYADRLAADLAGQRLHLVGWCFGGTVGFEVAAQLERRGMVPASTIVLDAPLPQAEDLARPFLQIERQFVELFTNVRDDATRYASLVDMKDKINAWGIKTSDADLDMIYTRFIRNYSRWLRYEPSMVQSHVILLKAMRPRWTPENFRSWPAIARDLSVIPVDATHAAIANGCGADATVAFVRAPDESRTLSDLSLAGDAA